MRIFFWIVGILAVLGIIPVIALYIGARTVPRPENVDNGELSPCPSTPNCVSTVDDDEQHGMAPIPFTGAAADARDRLLTILNNLPRATIITEGDTYIYMETRSPTMGFVDDVEFIIDEDAGVIRFRSAARMGQSDLNKNRERMELITREFAQTES